ncbi:hypothetical protein V7P28_44000, partial [Klebsiella michiganensis]
SGAENFYVQCGWEKAGEIPRYALMPDGELLMVADDSMIRAKKAGRNRIFTQEMV